MCAEVLEFTRTKARRSLEDAVEIFLRDRKSTVRRIAEDTERSYERGCTSSPPGWLLTGITTLTQ
jgi:hypothetical protein